MAKSVSKKKTPIMPVNETSGDSNPGPGGASGVDMSSQPKEKIISTSENKKKLSMNLWRKSNKAGLQFPAFTVHRQMRRTMEHGSVKVGGLSSLYMSGVLEYLTAEILELAGNASRDMKVKRITPRQILLAIKGDEELDTLIKATVAGGGVIPHIHKSLIPKKSSDNR